MGTRSLAASRRALDALPVFLGLITFIVVVGPTVLGPTNIAWLQEGDPATHYLGWLFFRTSNWSLPLGLNPRYGLELGNAIVYSDSIPLLAFLFKPFDGNLPEPFQYFGLWLLVCFVLQAWFAWKLVGLIDQNIFVRLFGAGLFVFAPPMIARLYGHLALVGHFLILAALYLCLRPNDDRRLLAWGTLLVVAVLVSSYFAAMVTVLWLCDLFWKRTANSVMEFAAISTILAVVSWQAGYFSIEGSALTAGAYGFHRVNLLSLFDSSGWSYLLPDLPEKSGDYEGFNFLGLGICLLLVLALPIVLTGKVKLHRLALLKPSLLLALLLFAAFAITNRIGIGASDFQYELPRKLDEALGIFRAAGRMFWPVFYMIVFTVIFIVVKGYGARIASVMLGIALVLQASDTSQAWIGLRNRMTIPPESHWATPLKSQFWTEAALKYTKLRVMPPANNGPNWEVFAYYAGIHRMATNSGYLARMSEKAMSVEQTRAGERLRSGTFEQDTLYILDQKAADQAAISIDADSDFLAEVDGFYVLAPGWKKCRECGFRKQELEPLRLDLGSKIAFTDKGDSQSFLSKGWSYPEPWGTWSEGLEAEIRLHLSARPTTIIVEAHPLVSPNHPKQRVEVSINGAPAVTAQLASNANIVIPVPEVAAFSGLISLRFKFPDTARPRDLGINEDTRQLALGLHALTIF